MRFNQPKPIFRQIADHIIELILSDHWIEGGRIPSVRDLATEVTVNPNTVARTYQMLGGAGVIHTRRGIGYFLADNAKRKALDYLKNNFVKDELPYFIKMLDLLEIDHTELEKYKK